jgi:hypothetical protein
MTLSSPKAGALRKEKALVSPQVRTVSSSRPRYIFVFKNVLFTLQRSETLQSLPQDL